jgi:hypothetical protein
MEVPTRKDGRRLSDEPERRRRLALPHMGLGFGMPSSTSTRRAGLLRCRHSGTLGCLVQWTGHPGVFILSSNHVLADLNTGQPQAPMAWAGCSSRCCRDSRTRP